MRRILFIKLGAIGDVIQAAAAALELKTIEPSCQIDWIVGESIRPILEGVDFVDRLIPVPDQALYHGAFLERAWFLLRGLYLSFKNAREYDVIYIGHTNSQYRLYAIPAIIKNITKKYLKPKIFIPPISKNRISAYLDFLSISMQAQSSASGALIRLRSRLPWVPALSSQLLGSGLKYVVLVPGGSKNLLRDDFLRRWPVAYYVDLAKRFIVDGFEVIITGGKGDVWVAPSFQGIPVIDLIGKTSIHDLLKIFEGAKLVVSHDTGPLHIATLTKAPIIALFGPTHASAVVPLERPSLKILDAVNKVACAPCYDGKEYAVCGNPICMQSHSVGDVYAAALSLLQQNA